MKSHTRIKGSLESYFKMSIFLHLQLFIQAQKIWRPILYNYNSILCKMRREKCTCETNIFTIVDLHSKRLVDIDSMPNHVNHCISPLYITTFIFIYYNAHIKKFRITTKSFKKYQLRPYYESEMTFPTKSEHWDNNEYKFKNFNKINKF